MSQIICHQPGELVLLITTVLFEPNFCRKFQREIPWFPPGQLGGELLEAIIGRQPTAVEKAGWAEEDGKEYEDWLDVAIVQWAESQSFPCLVNFWALLGKKYSWKWEVSVTPIESIPSLTQFIFELNDDKKREQQEFEENFQ